MRLHLGPFKAWQTARQFGTIPLPQSSFRYANNIPVLNLGAACHLGLDRKWILTIRRPPGSYNNQSITRRHKG